MKQGMRACDLRVSRFDLCNDTVEEEGAMMYENRQERGGVCNFPSRIFSALIHSPIEA